MEHNDIYYKGHNLGTYLYMVCTAWGMVTGYLTQSNIAWAIGIIAGIATTISAISTHKKNRQQIRESKTNTRLMELEIKKLNNK